MQNLSSFGKTLAVVSKITLCVLFVVSLWGCAASQYKKVAEVDSIEAYQNFIQKHPKKVELVAKAEKRIKELRWEEARKIHSIEAYEKFLALYPNDIVFGLQVNEHIDNLQFQKAKNLDTIQAYQEYLRLYEHKEGRHINEVKDEIKRIEWGNAKAEDTIEAYKKFIEKYQGDTSFTPEAKNRIDDLEFANAQGINTIQAYELYLSQYNSQGRHTEEAKRQIEILTDDLDFENAKKSHTVEAYELYLSQYNNQGRHTEEAKEQIKLLRWEITIQENSVEAYQAFLKKYPNDFNLSSEAKNRIDDLEFLKVQKVNTIKAYASYINSYGVTGRHYQKAESRLQELEWASAKKTNTIEAYIQFLSKYPGDSDFRMNAKNNLVNLLYQTKKAKSVRISPEQELYNNIAFSTEMLAESTSSVYEIQAQLDKFDSSMFSKKGVDLLNSFQLLCEQLVISEINIKFLREYSQYPNQQLLKNIIAEGAKGVEIVQGIDQFTLGKVVEKQNYTDGALVGAIIGLIKSIEEAKERREKAEYNIKQEQYKQYSLITEYYAVVEQYKKYLSERQDFDPQRLYEIGVFKTAYTTGQKIERFNNSNMAMLSIIALNSQIANDASEYSPISDWESFVLGTLLHWPSCVAKKHSTYVQSLVNLSYIALEKEEHMNSENFSNKAIELDSRNETAWNNRGIARLWIGKEREALSDIEKALVIAPNYSWLWFSKARVLAKGFDNKNEAVNALEKAILLGFDDIRRLRNEKALSSLHGFYRFDDLVEVKTECLIEWGVFNDDIHLKNKSAFPLTNVALYIHIEKGTEYWEKTLTTKDSIVAGGEEEWINAVSIPGSSFTEFTYRVSCDQCESY